MSNYCIPTTPWRFFAWFIKPALPLLSLATLLMSCAAVAIIAEPMLIAQVVDHGLQPRSWDGFWTWISIAAGVAMLYPVFFVLGYRLSLIPEARLRQRAGQLLSEHLNWLGAGAHRTVSSGEMVHLATEDGRKISQAITEVAVIVTNLVIFISGIGMVWLIHPLLGAVLSLGIIPTALVAGPLLNRLQKRQSAYRAASAQLTGQATDVVGGLRVLRGVGGDSHYSTRYRESSSRLLDKGYHVARSFSWVQGLRHSIPFGFVAAVTWVGANLTLHDTISFGELAATFGYASLLIMATARLIDSASQLVEAHVSSGRMARFFSHEPDLSPDGTDAPVNGTLFDFGSGLSITPGTLTVVVSSETSPAAAACRRLARLSDSEATWGDIPVRDIALSQVRSQITVLDDDDYLFAGSLRETMFASSDGDQVALDALWAANAWDVYTSLGSTLEGEITEGGRNLSGGQRQRLGLARALSVDPDYLLAIEPTSAVDAHTESLISQRVSELRQGSTTVVATCSPLWLAQADHAVWLVDGKVHRQGAHRELSADPAYRALTSHEELSS